MQDAIGGTNLDNTLHDWRRDRAANTREQRRIIRVKGHDTVVVSKRRRRRSRGLERSGP
jgi:hypothetical protein